MAAIDVGRRPVDAAVWLARAFHAGRQLAVWAPGADDHAHHVAVEFVHPVIAGTRPLPARAVRGAVDLDAGDALLIIGFPPADTAAHLKIATSGSEVDVVRSYHLLWELVQVALEHPGLTGGDAVAGGDSTDFLYPFLDAAEDDEAGLRSALDVSAEGKRADSDDLLHQTMIRNERPLEEAASATREATGGGGVVYVMGNGGSSTDAARLVRILRSGGVPAHTLAADSAVLTALANDVGVERIFSRQIEAFARPGDVLVGCSTSGTSPNLLAAFAEATDRGLMTIGCCGYEGGAFAANDAVAHTLTVMSSSVHRIQEAQAALLSAYADRVIQRQP